MSTTSGGKNTQGTGGGGKGGGPPTTDKMPAPPPAPFQPIPSPKTSSVSNAGDTSEAVKIGGSEALVDGSSMTVAPPGNKPSHATGGGLVNAAMDGKQKVTSGSTNTKAGGKGVAQTTSTVTMHQASAAGQMSETSGVLMDGAGTGVTTASAEEEGKAKDPSKKTAGAPLSANEKGGGASGAEDPATGGDPVEVVTGFVVDAALELALPGAIPLEFKRIYSSGRFKELGDLGRGGWTHNLAQWIEVGEAVVRFRDADGRTIYFEKIAAGESTFHRRERLTLQRDHHDRYVVVDAKTGLARELTSTNGGRARLTAIRDGYGNRISLEYQGETLIRAVDTAGRTLGFRYDDARRIRRIEVWSAGGHPTLCLWVDYRYSAEGDLESAVDALGGTLRYRYDALHRLTRRTLQTGVSFYYTYDDDTGRSVRTVGDEGIYSTDLSFDLAKRTTTTSGNQEPRKFTWNAAGLVTREETFDGLFARIREYDKDQHLLAESNAAGERVAFEYDRRGNLIQRRDPAGNVTRWEIARDRPIARLDPSGLITTYTYDAQGQLASVEYPNGLRYALTRDGQGRLVSVHGKDGLVAAFAYDEQHNIVEESDARGAVTRYEHDLLGRPTARIDALGRVTRVAYDRLGRRVGVQFPDGTTSRADYDARGRVVRYVDALGNSSTMEYQGLHALARFVEPTGQVWEFEYDELERLERIINPRKEEYRFSYDDAGRVEEEIQFHDRRLKYRWNKAEHLARIDYSDETFRDFSYDALGNLIADDSPHGNIKFERDKLGRLGKALLKDPSATVVTSFERDALGRVVFERQGQAELRFEYDDHGRRSARVLPNGATTRYYYDVAGALSALDHDGYKVAIQRDVLGREVRRHLYSGQVDVLSAYDAGDRLVDQTVTAPMPEGHSAVSVLARRQYRYDANGRVDKVHDARWGTTYYRYDSLGQLLQAQRGALNEVFEYDVTGSLQNKLNDLAGLGQTTPWRIEKGNLLVETPDALFENDAQGRRTKKIPKDAATREPDEHLATEYWWDCRDRLREVREADGRRYVYTYDAFGRRMRKDLWPKERADVTAMVDLALKEGKEALPKPRVIEFWWDGDALAGDVDSERGTRVFVNDRATLVPLLQQEGGETFAVVTDHIGVPKELVDGRGRVAWSATHEAWGRIAQESRAECTKTSGSPFRLVGQFADEETGLCSTRFRFFAPTAGRWMSPDPLGLDAGFNCIAYGGAPSSEVDPLGLQALNAGKPLSHWLQDHPALLDQARQMFAESPQWQGIDPETTPVRYVSPEDVERIRSLPGESGGHHPHGLALGGPEGQTLTPTNETRTQKNPLHTAATSFQRQIIRVVKSRSGI